MNTVQLVNALVVANGQMGPCHVECGEGQTLLITPPALPTRANIAYFEKYAGVNVHWNAPSFVIAMTSIPKKKGES